MLGDVGAAQAPLRRISAGCAVLVHVAYGEYYSPRKSPMPCMRKPTAAAELAMTAAAEAPPETGIAPTPIKTFPVPPTTPVRILPIPLKTLRFFAGVLGDPDPAALTCFVAGALSPYSSISLVAAFRRT